MIYEKLRELRNKKGISAKEMADALNLKTEAAYYKKESGMNKFSVKEAKVVADKLGMTIEEIFFDLNVSCGETRSAKQKPKAG